MEKLQISLAAARVNAELTQSQVAEIIHIPIDCIFFGKRTR